MLRFFLPRLKIPRDYKAQPQRPVNWQMMPPIGCPCAPTGIAETYTTTDLVLPRRRATSKSHQPLRIQVRRKPALHPLKGSCCPAGLGKRWYRCHSNHAGPSLHSAMQFDRKISCYPKNHQKIAN